MLKKISAIQPVLSVKTMSKDDSRRHAKATKRPNQSRGILAATFQTVRNTFTRLIPVISRPFPSRQKATKARLSRLNQQSTPIVISHFTAKRTGIKSSASHCTHCSAIPDDSDPAHPSRHKRSLTPPHPRHTDYAKHASTRLSPQCIRPSNSRDMLPTHSRQLHRTPIIDRTAQATSKAQYHQSLFSRHHATMGNLKKGKILAILDAMKVIESMHGNFERSVKKEIVERITQANRYTQCMAVSHAHTLMQHTMKNSAVSPFLMENHSDEAEEELLTINAYYYGRRRNAYMTLRKPRRRKIKS